MKSCDLRDSVARSHRTTFVARLSNTLSGGPIERQPLSRLVGQVLQLKVIPVDRQVTPVIDSSAYGKAGHTTGAHDNDTGRVHPPASPSEVGDVNLVGGFGFWRVRVRVGNHGWEKNSGGLGGSRLGDLEPWRLDRAPPLKWFVAVPISSGVILEQPLPGCQTESRDGTINGASPFSSSEVMVMLMYARMETTW